MQNKKSLLSFLWHFARKQKWTFFMIVILDSLAWPFDTLIWPYLLSKFIDIFTKFDSLRNEAYSSLVYPIIGAICLVFFVEIVSRIMGFLYAKALPKLESDIRIHTFDHVQHHSPKYFNEKFAGNLSNKISELTTHLEKLIEEFYFPLIPAFASVLLAMILLSFIHPLFCGIVLIWLVFHLTICFLFIKKINQYEFEHTKSKNELFGKIVDSLSNNFTVNLFYRFKQERKTISSYQEKERDTNIATKVYIEKMRCLLAVVLIIGIFFGMFIPMFYLWSNYKITSGQVIQVFTTMWNLTLILWRAGASLPILFSSAGGLKQAFSIIEDPQDLGDHKASKKLQVTNGDITFDKVFFSYGKKSIFENKTLHIKGKEKIGLVGYTGAGKSTFINLILRFFPLQQGKILIDNQDISTTTLKSLRNQIALIPQDPILFHRTIEENILYGKPHATQEEFMQAVQLARCDSFIEKIPNKYKAKVGERGTKLSGGEKQRIAIARASLIDSPILILDEATSSLDSLTEKYIQDSLEKLMKNRTTIIIAHRLSTISQMDRILVFDRGKIIEEGSHKNLIKQNGHYAKMWSMQTGGFLPDKPS